MNWEKFLYSDTVSSQMTAAFSLKRSIAVNNLMVSVSFRSPDLVQNHPSVVNKEDKAVQISTKNRTIVYPRASIDHVIQIMNRSLTL